jgi:hypothetical protein
MQNIGVEGSTFLDAGSSYNPLKYSHFQENIAMTSIPNVNWSKKMIRRLFNMSRTKRRDRCVQGGGMLGGPFELDIKWRFDGHTHLQPVNSFRNRKIKVQAPVLLKLIVTYEIRGA